MQMQCMGLVWTLKVPFVWTLKVPFLQTPVSNKGRTDSHLSMGSCKQLFPERRARDPGLSLGLEILAIYSCFHVLSVSLCDMSPVLGSRDVWDQMYLPCCSREGYGMVI